MTERTRNLVIGGAVLVLGAAALGFGALTRQRGDNANGSVQVRSVKQLSGTWNIANDLGAPRRVVQSVQLEVQGDRLGVRTGCNSGGGTITVQDSRLVINGPGLAVTEMACEPALMAQEQWVVEMLQAKPRLELSGPHLSLLWGEGERYWITFANSAVDPSAAPSPTTTG